MNFLSARGAVALRARMLAVPRGIRLSIAAATLGLLAVGFTETGAGDRPAIAVPVFLLGIAAAFAPLRAGVPTAIVLACLEGTIADLLGSPAGYWKEAFLAGLVVRSLAVRRPSRREIAAWGTAGLVYLVYLASGTSALAVGWAAKILLFSVAAGWALYRLRPGYAVWLASYCALAVAAGANVIVAIWQRAVGVDHLLELGLPYAERVRQAPEGELRAFGTLTTAAPFSYVLALVLLAWLGLLLGRRDERRLALETAWVPTAAVVGIAYSIDRIAIVAAVVALVVVALRSSRSRIRLGLLAIAPVAVGLALALAGSARGFLAEGFLLRSESADARRVLWSKYWDELSAFGAGPGAAGAAYTRWAVKSGGLPVEFLRWYDLEAGPPPFRWMGANASLVLGGPGQRPAATLTLLAASQRRARTVTFTYRRTVLATTLVPTEVFVPVVLFVPTGNGRAFVAVTARPGAERAAKEDPRAVSVRVTNVAARKGRTLTPAERVYERAVAEGLSVNTLAGTGPGLVDNLYLSWLFQYGVLVGGVVCGLYLVALLWPLVRPGDEGSPILTARLWGVFLVVAAIGVNAWEEFPVDLLAALVLAQAFALRARDRFERVGPVISDGRQPPARVPAGLRARQWSL